MAQVTRALAGDQLPPAVAAVLERLQGGDSRGAAEPFSAGAVYAYWDGEGDERKPREIARGPRAILRAWQSLRSSPELRIGIHDGRQCFLEGVHTDDRGTPVATFCWSAQLDEEGAIARMFSSHCRPSDPSATWEAADPGTPADARVVLERYFRRLAEADFPATVACFSRDVLYDHPPYVEGEARPAFHGRDELLAGFEKRGPSPARQVIVSLLQSGSDAFIEGVVDGIPNGGSFVSSVAFDDDGLMRRYLAFYSAERIPRI